MKIFFDGDTLLRSLKTAFIGLAVFGALAAVSAYTDPTQAPPQGGTPPINVGPTAQKKEGSLLLGANPPSPAFGGSVSVGRNLYAGDASTNDVLFAGEFGKARADFSGKNLFGIGYEAVSQRVGMFGVDFRVMDSLNTALLKNIFANDYWIGALNGGRGGWASQLAAGSGGVPNLQQVTETGASTNKDVVFQGKVWFSQELNSAHTVLNPQGDPNTGVYSNKAINTASTMTARDVYLSAPNSGSPRWASQPYPITVMQTVEVNSYPSGLASVTSNKTFCALSKTRIGSSDFSGGDIVECRIEGVPGNWTIIAQRNAGRDSNIVCGAICFGN